MKTVIVAGVRTPFAKSGTVLKKFTAVELGRMAVGELVARSGVDPATVDELIYGTVVHDPHAGNIAREVGLTTLPKTVHAHTVSRACATSNQAIVAGANLIEVGQATAIIAGGAESLSHIPILVSDRLSERLVALSRAKAVGARVRTLAGIRPGDLVPKQPQIAEPTTGETMGESAERMAKANGISREDQDRWALRSHQRAAAGTDDGRLTSEIVRTYLPPDYENVVSSDNGIRSDTSLEKLSSLRPVFDRKYGTVTAGNASPLTDGGSAVLLMSEERARAEGFEILGRIRSYAFAALDPAGQLLQGPAFAAPLALERAGVTMRDIGLMEMHEAFASQVLSNLQWLDSDTFARDQLGRANRVGHPDPDRINVMGGSIAIGHPFAATGARVTTTLLNEMKRRDVGLGLVTVCAAGGMGFAMVLERV
ncbi:MAG: acetyl-CoA C-acyltransferase FadI [Gemmatimonadales bacterium]|jgi:acetyl-CoA acyltransferase|nr:MAG: acetyl-CoA C-acyltransferase FadI [Gemmatimonadales bacterium]